MMNQLKQKSIEQAKLHEIKQKYLNLMFRDNVLVMPDHIRDGIEWFYSAANGAKTKSPPIIIVNDNIQLTSVLNSIASGEAPDANQASHVDDSVKDIKFQKCGSIDEIFSTSYMSTYLEIYANKKQKLWNTLAAFMQQNMTSDQRQQIANGTTGPIDSMMSDYFNLILFNDTLSKKFEKYMPGLAYESGWFSWMEYVMYMAPEETAEITKDLKTYMSIINKGIFGVIMLDDVAIILRTPKKAILIANNQDIIQQSLATARNTTVVNSTARANNQTAYRLHSIVEPALQWKSGINQYFIQGINFPQATWEGVAPRKWDMRRVLAISNTEQRSKAIAHYGPERMVKDLTPRIIDVWGTEEDGYTLLEIPDIRSPTTGRTAKLLKYTDPKNTREKLASQGLESRWYYSGVPFETKSAIEAAAWKFKTNPEVWAKLRVQS